MLLNANPPLRGRKRRSRCRAAQSASTACASTREVGAGALRDSDYGDVGPRFGLKAGGIGGGLGLRLLLPLVAICLLAEPAPALDYIACRPHAGPNAVTDMFTSNHPKWQKVRKEYRRKLERASTPSWIKVRTKAGHWIECRIQQRIAEPVKATDTARKGPRKRSFKPSRGGPGAISPEKITVTERMKLYMPYIEDAAEKFQIPVEFIKGVVKVESNFNYKAKSPVGAMGLMQLMPRTATSLGVSDPYDPRQNIMGGTKFLRRLANRYKGDMVQVLSAYNAGPGAVAKHDGGIPYTGAERYVRAVLDAYYGFLDKAQAESK